MAKCYIVSEGEYSDYYILGVFTNKEAAEAYKVFHALRNAVEEFELDPPIERIECNGDA